MKSLSNHLQNIGFIKNKKIKEKTSVNRSSGIFPFFISKKIDTEILFLGYWYLKRKIRELKFIYILRSKDGNILKKKINNIKITKAYKISIKKELMSLNVSRELNTGSFEFEIISNENLVFTYPAVIMNYVTKNSSSFTHTCGRIFNNIKDQKSVMKTKTPETGFDILPNKEYRPFFSFVNGPKKIKKHKLKLNIISDDKLNFRKNITIENLKPYETKFIFSFDENEKNKLKKKSTVTIAHQYKNFYPRFFSGNFHKDHTCVMLTHSYYDLSKLKNNEQYSINQNKSLYFDSYKGIPLFLQKNYKTELCVYPNSFLKSQLLFSMNIYNNKGQLIENLKNIVKISKNFVAPVYFDLNKIVRNRIKKKLKLTRCHCRVFFSSNHVPSRLTWGLNIVNSNKKNNITLPTNISFTPIPYNLIDKKGIFRWCPLLNKKDSQFIISNISNIKKGYKKSNIVLNFWREQDDKSLEKKIKIADNGFYWFFLNKQKKIKNFLKGKSGWVTIRSDNQYVDGFYFEDYNNGAIGGDHFF